MLLNLVQTCQRPRNPTNGDVISRNKFQNIFKPGEKIWFKCDGGFDLIGNKDFICREDGNWKPQPFPRCVQKSELCKRIN